VEYVPKIARPPKAAFSIGAETITRQIDSGGQEKGIFVKKNRGTAKRMTQRMIKSSKDRGAWAELCFAMRAMQEGLRPAKPWGEPTGYDFLVDCSRGIIVSVQVKSTIRENNSCYTCTVRTSHKAYKKNSFHFLAAYIIPENIWYIFPGKMVWGQSTFGLYPFMKESKYYEYKEAWHLLRGRRPTVIPCIQACAEDYPADLPEDI
jgi:hypothetical protein